MFCSGSESMAQVPSLCPQVSKKLTLKEAGLIAVLELCDT